MEMPPYSIMINGVPYDYFKSKRGMVREAHFSYLFVLVMELLIDSMLAHVKEGKFHLHYICKNPMMTHLAFADDVIAFLKGDLGTTQSLREILYLKSAQA